MRKLIWSVTGLLVLGTSAIVLAAQHAADNPDSFLGQCFHRARSLGTPWNPLLAIRRLTGQEQAGHRIDKPVAQGVAANPEPANAVDMAPPVLPPAVAEAQEMAEPIVVEQQGNGLPAPGNEEDRPTPLPAFEESNVDLPPPVPGIDRDLPDNPPMMPYIPDDEETGRQEQAQDGPGCCPCSMLKILGLLCGPESCAPGSRTLGEAIADFLQQLSTEEESDAESPTGESGQPSRAMPSSGTSGRSPAPREKSTGNEPQEVPTRPDLDFSELQEAPTYHLQYPGCPFTGRCPSPQHPKGLPLHKSGGDLVVHPEVDTLECRPTDLIGDWGMPF